MTLVLMVSMIPTSAFAESAGTAESPYQIGDTVTNDGSEQPAGVTVENSYWARQDVYDTSAAICQKEEHDHAASSCEQGPAAVECTLEGHPTGGETAHTHEDGTACNLDVAQDKWFTIGTVWSCGEEAHVHSEAKGCYELTQTVWTLTAVAASEDEPAEKVCEEGCILTGEAHDECLVWVACTKTAGCELSDGHEGDCSGISGYAGEAVSITVSGNTYRNKYVVIYNDTAKTEGVYYINNSGTIVNMDGSAATFEAGTYTIYYGPTGGQANRNFYKAENVVIAENATGSKSVTLSSKPYGSVSTDPNDDQTRWATSVYYNTSTFSHIDIRVAGSYVININGTPYSATISNPSLTLKVDGVVKNTNATTSSTSYEWRLDETTVSRTSTIEITLVVDLTYTDGEGIKHTLNDVTIVYDNVNDMDKFIEAVAVCDGVQGFDFIVDVQDIQKVLEYYTVTYEWRVYDTDGFYTALPSGAPAVPGPHTGIEQNTNYVYDTEYVEGSSFYDYNTGLLYTFHGWDTWSHSSTFNVDPTAVGYTALDDGDTSAANNDTVPITADTYIYGYWTVTELEPSDAYLVIDKKIVGLESDAAALADAKLVWFRVDTGIDRDNDDDTTVDVDYTQIEAMESTDIREYRLPVYQYDTPFVITEYNADVPGYTYTTAISVTGDNASGDRDSGSTVNVTLTPEYSEDETAKFELGTVTFTNTYTKNVGTDVSEYPEMTLLKTASDTSNVQSGVVFTLYSDEACTTAVTTFTTANNGYALIDFALIDVADTETDTYYLKETISAAGYKLDPYVYAITLTAQNRVEEMRWNEDAQRYEYVWVTYHTLSVNIPEDSDAVFTNGAYNRLHITNDPELGTLNLSKIAEGLAGEDKAKLSVDVIVYGPITRGEGNVITDIGSTRELTLDSENQWKASVAELPLGEYLVHESFASVHGYTLALDSVTYGYDGGNYATTVYNNVTSAVVKVESETAVAVNITNTYSEWDVADFYIHKVSETGDFLSGAVFTLYTDEACTTAATGTGITLSATTGTDGYAHFSGYEVPEDVEIVTYYLREDKAPDGYYLDSTVYKVEIKSVTVGDETNYEPKISVKSGETWVEAVNWSSTTDLLTVTNTSVKGSITVDKSFVVSSGEDYPETLSAIGIHVVGDNGFEKNYILTKENNWKLEINNLLLGTYTISEYDTKAPGYTLNTDKSTTSVQVTLTESNPGATTTAAVISGTAALKNDYTRIEEVYENPTTLTIYKVNKDNEALAGAEFTLYRYAADGETVVSSATFTTNADGKVVFDMLSGWIVDGDDVDGVYVLRETKAPEGYVETDTTWEIKVVEDDGELTKFELNEQKTAWEAFWDWIIGKETSGYDAESKTLTVTNEKLLSIKVEKKWDDDSYYKRPTEVTVALKRNGEQVAAVELNEENNWSYTWTEVEIDDVIVKLTNKDTWTVEEKDDFSDLGYAAPSYDVEEDAWIITNTRTPNLIDVTVTKEWELNGAHHKTPESVTVQLMQNGVAYGEKVTLNEENDWSYTWKDLSDVYVWTVKEDTVTGYTLTAVKNDIATNGNVDVTLTNTRIINPVEITVTKTWVNGEKDVKVTFPTSVKVALYRDGVKYETVTLSADNNWKYTWNLTDEHEWTVDEPSVPSGYIKTIKTTTTTSTAGIESTYAITNTYNSNPKTGDSTNFLLWGMGMTVPVAALFVLMLLGGNKKKGKYQA